MTALKHDVFLSYARPEPLDKRMVARRPTLLAVCSAANVRPLFDVNPDEPKRTDTGINADQPVQPVSSSNTPNTTTDATGGEQPPDYMRKRLIDLKEVLRKIPVTRQTLTNWEKAGTFPRRIILPDGVTACWLESEVHSWIEQSARRRPGNDKD